jgi:hypothetical protein
MEEVAMAQDLGVFWFLPTNAPYSFITELNECSWPTNLEKY